MTIKKSNGSTTRMPRKPEGISELELQKIHAYLQRAVYCWCNYHDVDGAEEDDWFSASDFVGGKNKDWNGTPLQCLYDNRVKQNSSDPVTAAGHDVGHEFKRMLCDDVRNFEARSQHKAWQYRWVT